MHFPELSRKFGGVPTEPMIRSMFLSDFCDLKLTLALMDWTL